MSWLSIDHATLEWPVKIANVSRMTVVSVSLASRATVFNTLFVWMFAFSRNTGVLVVILPPSSLAGRTFDLIVRKGRIMTRMLWLPILALH